MIQEYRVRFNKRPGGPDDEAYFIELEDDQGKSLGGPLYTWKDEGDSVVLILPTYEEKFRVYRNTLSNIRNSIEWAVINYSDPKEMLAEILTEVDEALESE